MSNNPKLQKVLYVSSINTNHIKKTHHHHQSSPQKEIKQFKRNFLKSSSEFYPFPISAKHYKNNNTSIPTNNNKTSFTHVQKFLNTYFQNHHEPSNTNPYQNNKGLSKSNNPSANDFASQIDQSPSTKSSTLNLNRFTGPIVSPLLYIKQKEKSHSNKHNSQETRSNSAQRQRKNEVSLTNRNKHHLPHSKIIKRLQDSNKEKIILKPKNDDSQNISQNYKNCNLKALNYRTFSHHEKTPKNFPSSGNESPLFRNIRQAGKKKTNEVENIDFKVLLAKYTDSVAKEGSLLHQVTSLPETAATTPNYSNKNPSNPKHNVLTEREPEGFLKIIGKNKTYAPAPPSLPQTRIATPTSQFTFKKNYKNSDFILNVNAPRVKTALAKQRPKLKLVGKGEDMQKIGQNMLRTGHLAKMLKENKAKTEKGMASSILQKKNEQEGTQVFLVKKINQNILIPETPPEPISNPFIQQQSSNIPKESLSHLERPWFFFKRCQTQSRITRKKKFLENKQQYILPTLEKTTISTENNLSKIDSNHYLGKSYSGIAQIKKKRKKKIKSKLKEGTYEEKKNEPHEIDWNFSPWDHEVSDNKSLSHLTNEELVNENSYATEEDTQNSSFSY